MSEVSGGAGWWMASDGKWYPPELHPDASTRPVSADAGQGSAVGPSTYLSQQNVPFQPVWVSVPLIASVPYVPSTS